MSKPTDAERIDWLECQHTLHKGVDILYVVTGYDVTLTYDGNDRATFHGEDFRDAIDNAMSHTK